MESKIPKFLSSGSLIGIVSPSGPVDEVLIETGKSYLESKGFRVVVGANAFNKNGYFAGSDQERLHDLQIMLDDHEVDAIWCARGGYGLIRIVDKLDFTEFEISPKWVVGFSDITVLHAAIQRFTGMCSIHGAMIKSLVFPETSDAVEVLSLLEGKSLTYKLLHNSLNRCGNAVGPLVGGNLALLYALRGTPFEFNYDGAVLFIEDIGEYHYQIDRMMQSLKLGGVLKNLQGLIVGQFSDVKENTTSFGQSVEEIITSCVADYNYPVCFGFDAGHEYPNHPLILGKTISLIVSNLQTEITI